MDRITVTAPMEEYLEPGIVQEHAAFQYTIWDYHMDSLNEKGKELLNESRERYARGDFKAHCEHWTFKTVGSGPGVTTDHRFLNSYNNIVLITWISPEENYLRSSPLIMIDPELKWCITKSGSMYSLNPEGKYQSEDAYALAVKGGELGPLVSK